MNVEELAGLLRAQTLSQGAGGVRVTGGMASDTMSRTLANGFAGMAWITCANHINALAVAVMTGAACLILCDGLTLDEPALCRAQQENIWVLSVRESAFETAGRLYEAGLRQRNGAQEQ